MSTEFHVNGTVLLCNAGGQPVKLTYISRSTSKMYITPFGRYWKTSLKSVGDPYVESKYNEKLYFLKPATHEVLAEYYETQAKLDQRVVVHKAKQRVSSVIQELHTNRYKIQLSDIYQLEECITALNDIQKKLLDIPESPC